jgi:hypothetical protein
LIACGPLSAAAYGRSTDDFRQEGRWKGAAMKDKRKVIATTIIVVVVAVTGLSLAAPAMAAVVRTGACSGHSSWMLTLKRDNGRIEADLEVQTPRAGQTWHAVFRDNGSVFGRATKVTQADGSFSATRFAPNQAGTDHIRVRAANATTGETCIATAAL